VNSFFHEKLDEFMNIYINDIMVYCKTTEKHVGHLEYDLNKNSNWKHLNQNLGIKGHFLRQKLHGMKYKGSLGVGSTCLMLF
jgi:hypothetical protein